MRGPGTGPFRPPKSPNTMSGPFRELEWPLLVKSPRRQLEHPVVLIGDRMDPSRNDLLTRREREVLALVAEGKTAREAASILGITKRTVEVHVSSIVQKLGVANRTHAVAVAIENGIIDGD